MLYLWMLAALVWLREATVRWRIKEWIMYVVFVNARCACVVKRSDCKMKNKRMNMIFISWYDTHLSIS